MIAHITADLGGNRIRRIGSATPSTSTWPTPGQEARDQITSCAAVPGSRSKDHVSPSFGGWLRPIRAVRMERIAGCADRAG